MPINEIELAIKVIHFRHFKNFVNECYDCHKVKQPQDVLPKRERPQTYLGNMRPFRRKYISFPNVNSNDIRSCKIIFGVLFNVR